MFLDSAYTETIRMGEDSLKRKKLSDIAYRAYQLGDSSLFKKAGRETLFLAMQLKDTLGIGDAHWNYGAFYLDREVYDSAYYHYNHAQRLFEAAPHPYYSGKMLYNMAVIQGRLKDYTACEVLLYYCSVPSPFWSPCIGTSSSITAITFWG
ncbi:hypothetical protein [Sinomicrobium oceani]|uniref:hypothetical protein n=1 Tax=Sinomicrobium oceani TaxID=1150368 RepID=UPI00227AE1AB|nr:hypothetical protein [Sinomicrobium oceani]